MKDILRNISLFFKDLFTPDDIDKELIKKLDHDPDDDALNKAISTLKKQSRKSIRRRSGKQWENQLNPHYS